MRKKAFGAVVGAAVLAAGIALGGCLARSGGDAAAREVIMATSTFKAQGLAVSAGYISPFLARDLAGAESANSNLAGAEGKNGADEGADVAKNFDVFFVNLIPQNASIIGAEVNGVSAQIAEIDGTDGAGGTNGANGAAKNGAKMAGNSAAAQDLPRGFEKFDFAPFKLDWARYFVIFVPSIEADTLKLRLTIGDKAAPNSNLATNGAKTAAKNPATAAPNSNLTQPAAPTSPLSPPSARGNNPTRSVSLDFAKVARYWRWSPAI